MLQNKPGKGALAVYLVGHDIDERRARYDDAKGVKRRIAKGVYIDVGDDPKEVCRANALRIATYLRPQAYLSYESAFLRGPVVDEDGVATVHMTGGSYTHAVNIEGMHIRVRKRPRMPFTDSLTLEENGRQLTVPVSCEVQTVLELLNRFPSDIGGEDGSVLEKWPIREPLRKMLTVHGRKQAMDLAQSIADKNSWKESMDRLLDVMDEFIMESSSQEIDYAMDDKMEFAQMKKLVSWHGAAVGVLTHDGKHFFYRPTMRGENAPFVNTTGLIPAFIANMFPEGALADHLARSDMEGLQNIRRLLCNISITGSPEEAAEIPRDILLSPLDGHMDDAAFTGKAYEDLVDLGNKVIKGAAASDMALMVRQQGMGTLSGMQVKVPVSLSVNGELGIATANRPWTHILKMPPVHKPAVEVAEWLGHQMALGAGLDAATTALVPMNGDVGILVERFDIPQAPADTRLYFAEDMCAMLDKKPDAKYTGTWEEMAHRMVNDATDGRLVAEQLLRRAVLSWVAGDGDAHLKNVSMLRTMDRGDFVQGAEFNRKIMAPVYDCVAGAGVDATTVMALPLNGKRDGLKIEDFVQFARRTKALTITEARAIVADAAKGAAEAAVRIANAPPAVLVSHARSETYLEALRRSAELAVERTSALGVTLSVSLEDVAAEVGQDATEEQHEAALTP